MLHDNNLIEMSLRLNRSEPLFRTIKELLDIKTSQIVPSKSAVKLKKISEKYIY